jgi:hypothetical protein
MCSRVTCPSCAKATWAGCGQHIEQALAGVPVSERCTCREERAASGRSGGFLARLLGR